MNLREFIICMLYSVLIYFLFMLNFETIIIGQNLGIELARIIGIDPNFQISVMSGGIASDVMFLLLSVLIIIEAILLPKIHESLSNLNEWLMENYSIISFFRVL